MDRLDARLTTSAPPPPVPPRGPSWCRYSRGCASGSPRSR